MYWEIPTLRAQADQVADKVADLPPIKWRCEIHTDKIPTLRAQADQVADLPILKTEIWDSYWQIPNVRAKAHQVADKMEDLPPPRNGDLRFILIDSYSGRPGSRSSGRSNPPKNKFEIHTDRFLLWELRLIKWLSTPPPN